MRFWLAIVAALVLSGCALVRHDAIVRGVFPSPESEAWARGVEVTEDWAR